MEKKYNYFLQEESIPRNFTIIELLVVIAIIAILMTILFPALNKAKNIAKQTLCAGNQKQSGVAIFMYADDYNGYFPVKYSLSSSGEGEASWHHVLWYRGDYLPKRGTSIGSDVLVCPSARPWGKYIDWRWTYGAHVGRYNTGSSIYDRNKSWWITVTSELIFLKLCDTPNPSSFILIADSIHTNKYQRQYFYSFLYSSRGIHLRHSRQAECFFVDGHVNACGKSKLKECNMISGYYNYDTLIPVTF